MAAELEIGSIKYMKEFWNACEKNIAELQRHGVASQYKDFLNEPGIEELPRMQQIGVRDFYRGGYVSKHEYNPSPAFRHTPQGWDELTHEGDMFEDSDSDSDCSSYSENAADIEDMQTLNSLFEGCNDARDKRSTYSKKFRKNIQTCHKVEHTMILGAAGHGKTTLLRRFARDAVKGCIDGIQKNHHLVHYLDARNFSAEEEMPVSSFLFGNMTVSPSDDAIVVGYAWMIQHSDQVVFVVDSLDTLGYELDNEEQVISPGDHARPGTILFNIFTGDLFPKCKILSSSREHQVVKYKHDLRPGKIISLVGLTMDAIERLVLGFLSDEEGKDVFKYLETECPELLALSETPLFLVFSLIGRKNNAGFVPKTMTGVMVNLLQSLIHSKHATVFNKMPLDEEIISTLAKMKELSYEGTKQGRVLFGAKDLKNADLSEDEVTDLAVMVPGAGKIQKEQRVLDGDKVTYFAHQSIQEVLCAMKVAEMCAEEFHTFVENNLHNPHYCVVRRMLCGLLLDPTVAKEASKQLLQASSENSDVLSASMKVRLCDATSNTERDCLEVLYSTCESGVGMKNIVPEHLGKISLSSPTTLDILAAASVFSHCTILDYFSIQNCLLQAVPNILQKLDKTCPKIFEMKLINFSSTGPDEMSLLGSFVKRCRVVELNLERCHLTVFQIQALQKAVQRAKVLELHVGIIETHESLPPIPRIRNQPRIMVESGIVSKLSLFIEGSENATSYHDDFVWEIDTLVCSVHLQPQDWHELEELLQCSKVFLMILSYINKDAQSYSDEDESSCIGTILQDKDQDKQVDNDADDDDPWSCIGRISNKCQVEELRVERSDITFKEMEAFKTVVETAHVERMVVGKRDSYSSSYNYRKIAMVSELHLYKGKRSTSAVHRKGPGWCIDSIEWHGQCSSSQLLQLKRLLQNTKVFIMAFKSIALGDKEMACLGELMEQCEVEELKLQDCMTYALGALKKIIRSAKAPTFDLSSSHLGMELTLQLKPFLERKKTSLTRKTGWEVDHMNIHGGLNLDQYSLLESLLVDSKGMQISVLKLLCMSHMTNESMLLLGNMTIHSNLQEILMEDCMLTFSELQLFKEIFCNANVSTFEVCNERREDFRIPKYTWGHQSQRYYPRYLQLPNRSPDVSNAPSGTRFCVTIYVKKLHRFIQSAQWHISSLALNTYLSLRELLNLEVLLKNCEVVHVSLYWNHKIMEEEGMHCVSRILKQVNVKELEIEDCDLTLNAMKVLMETIKRAEVPTISFDSRSHHGDATFLEISKLCLSVTDGLEQVKNECAWQISVLQWKKNFTGFLQLEELLKISKVSCLHIEDHHMTTRPENTSLFALAIEQHQIQELHLTSVSLTLSEMGDIKKVVGAANVSRLIISSEEKDGTVTGKVTTLELKRNPDDSTSQTKKGWQIKIMHCDQLVTPKMYHEITVLLEYSKITEARLYFSDIENGEIAYLGQLLQKVHINDWCVCVGSFTFFEVQESMFPQMAHFKSAMYGEKPPASEVFRKTFSGKLCDSQNGWIIHSVNVACDMQNTQELSTNPSEGGEEEYTHGAGKGWQIESITCYGFTAASLSKAKYLLEDFKISSMVLFGHAGFAGGEIKVIEEISQQCQTKWIVFENCALDVRNRSEVIRCPEDTKDSSQHFMESNPEAIETSPGHITKLITTEKLHLQNFNLSLRHLKTINCKPKASTFRCFRGNIPGGDDRISLSLNVNDASIAIGNRSGLLSQIQHDMRKILADSKICSVMMNEMIVDDDSMDFLGYLMIHCEAGNLQMEDCQLTIPQLLAIKKLAGGAKVTFLEVTSRKDQRTKKMPVVSKLWLTIDKNEDTSCPSEATWRVDTMKFTMVSLTELLHLVDLLAVSKVSLLMLIEVRPFGAGGISWLERMIEQWHIKELNLQICDLKIHHMQALKHIRAKVPILKVGTSSSTHGMNHEKVSMLILAISNNEQPLCLAQPRATWHIEHLSCEWTPELKKLLEGTKITKLECSGIWKSEQIYWICELARQCAVDDLMFVTSVGIDKTFQAIKDSLGSFQICTLTVAKEAGKREKDFIETYVKALWGLASNVTERIILAGLEFNKHEKDVTEKEFFYADAPNLKIVFYDGEVDGAKLHKEKLAIVAFKKQLQQAYDTTDLLEVLQIHQEDPPRVIDHSIQTLSLEEHELSEADMRILARVINQCHQLRLFELKQCVLEASAFETMNTLLSCREENDMKLSINNTVGVRNVLQEVCRFMYLLAIESLDLSDNSLKSEDISLMEKSLSKQKISTLRELNLSYNPDMQAAGLKSLGQILQSCMICKIEVIDCKLMDDMLQQLQIGLGSGKVKELRELDISYNGEISREGFKCLSEILCGNKLKKLRMVECDLTDEKLDGFASGMGDLKIRALNISCNKELTDKGFSTLAELVKNCSIEYLRLSNCDITEEKLQSFNLQATEVSKITGLDVSYNAGMETEEYAALGDTVTGYKVHTLSVAGCEVDEELVQTLEDNVKHQISGLSIGDNRTIGKGVQNIARIAKTCELKELDMSDCMLTLNQIQEFKVALDGAKIAVLDLSDRRRVVREDYIEAVCDLLPHVTRILKLTFRKMDKHCESLLQDKINSFQKSELVIEIGGKRHIKWQDCRR